MKEEIYSKTINQNNLSRVITLREGKKVNLSIGQVKEVMKITFEELCRYDDAVVLRLMNRYRHNLNEE